MDSSEKSAPEVLYLAKKSKSFFQGLKKATLVEKFYNPAGLVFFIVLAAIIGFGIATFGVIFGLFLLLVVIGVPTIYCIVAYPQVGIIALLVLAYTLFYLGSLGLHFPLGTLADGMEGMLILATVVSLKRHDDWARLKGPVSTMVLVWIGYNLLQLGNPSAVSRMAWLLTIRGIAIVMLCYFVFVYNIRTLKFVKIIFKVWMVMSIYAALYAVKQEYIGFSASEEAYLYSDPEIKGLLFIAGHWRKFSIFSDPVAFAYNMSMSATFCIALIAGDRQLWKKLILGGMAMLFLIAMLYSGTRGANVLVPVALFLFGILNYSKKVLIAVCVAALFLVALINVPTGDPNIQRFQTAFKPNDDASYKLRKFNQERIKPYIWSHPIGFGLGATGGWGKRFGDGSVVSQFQPDSGYIRVAVELGWVGLFIFCTLMFTIMKTGINNYYKIKDPEIKNYCLAIVMIIFAYNIANFPQEALVQFPSNILFSLDMAMLTILYKLDKEKQEQLAEAASPNKVT